MSGDEWKMRYVRRYRMTDREAWQEQIGSEADRVDWVEVREGVPVGIACHIVRNAVGVWFGYVRIEPEHPWYGMTSAQLPAEAHDAAHCGITYACRGMIGWDGARHGDRSPWRPPGAMDHDGGIYVTERAAIASTRALARVAMTARDAGGDGRGPVRVRVCVVMDDRGIYGAATDEYEARDAYHAHKESRYVDEIPAPVFRVVWVEADIVPPAPPPVAETTEGRVVDGGAE
jgi:hypothetical protein